MSKDRSIDRRRFLTGTLATAAAAVAGPGLLAACTTGSSAANPTQDVSKLKLPTYIPYTKVTPDLKGNPQGLLDAFLRYPANPVHAFTAPPGNGGTVSGFVQTASPIPPALGQNSYWQELNRRLGVDLQLTIVPTPDMAIKFATLVAGNDLPDIIEPALNTPNGMPAGIANLPAWLAARCHDLTPLLAGDAVKEYPFLANLPTDAWKQCRYNGGIYGVPVPRGVGGTLMFRRDDLFTQLGVNPNPTTFAEFRDVCKQISSPSANRWACAQAPLDFIRMMLGLPWRWRNEGGKLTSSYELEENKQALSDAAQMMKDGLIHPDSTTNNAPVKNWFNSGQALLISDRYTAWPQYFANNVAGPGFDLGGMRPPKYNGGGFAGTWQAEPTNNFTAFKKTSDTRIKELLKITNWLAAPFGTEEYLFRKFGLPGVHYNLVDGSPVQTQAGVTQTVLGIRYLVDAPDVIFIPGSPSQTRKSYEYQASIIPTSIKDPQTGLFSDTWSRRQGQLGTIINNAQNDILAGRQPVSAWDDVVKQWKAAGGDKVRTELEQALKQA
jgi:putative aldouronate transport system substrate-binding protein